MSGMRSARYYELEAKEIRRVMYDVRDQKLRALLGRVARSYEELTADIETGAIRVAAVALRESEPEAICRVVGPTSQNRRAGTRALR